MIGPECTFGDEDGLAEEVLSLVGSVLVSDYDSKVVQLPCDFWVGGSEDGGLEGQPLAQQRFCCG